MVDRDFECGACEDAVFRPTDSVSADSSDFAFTGHDVRDGYEMSNINFESSAFEGVFHFVDDGLSSGLDTKTLVDLIDVVGVGSPTIDAGEFADTRKIRTNGRNVEFASVAIRTLDIRSNDVGQTLQSEFFHLFFKLQKSGVSW